MRLFFRSALGLTLLTGLASCDYAANSPGINTQFRRSWANPPGYTNADIDRDSINYRQTVRKPIGEGSATAIKNGSVDDQLNSAPAGKSAASSQEASGKPGNIDQNMNQPKGNGAPGEAQRKGQNSPAGNTGGTSSGGM